MLKGFKIGRKTCLYGEWTERYENGNQSNMSNVVQAISTVCMNN